MFSNHFAEVIFNIEIQVELYCTVNECTVFQRLTRISFSPCTAQNQNQQRGAPAMQCIRPAATVS